MDIVICWLAELAIFKHSTFIVEIGQSNSTNIGGCPNLLQYTLCLAAACERPDYAWALLKIGWV